MQDKKTTRFRQTVQSGPQGFSRVNRTLVQVAETDGPIPTGAVETTDELHDWQEVPAETE